MAENNKFACTVVSIVPFELKESKPGLIPGNFIVPASDGKNPVCLIVKEARHNVYLDDSRGSLPIRDASDEVARSIVDDFIDSQLGRTETAYPGIFWVPGEHTPESIKKEHSIRLAQAAMAQKEWFNNICKIADDDWSRYRRHNVISDFQRKAGEFLGLRREEHEWMSPALTMSSERCPSCQTLVTPGTVICQVCKFVLDKNKYKAEDYALVR